jgi:hypothetical protein
VSGQPIDLRLERLARAGHCGKLGFKGTIDVTPDALVIVRDDDMALVMNAEQAEGYATMLSHYAARARDIERARRGADRHRCRIEPDVPGRMIVSYDGKERVFVEVRTRSEHWCTACKKPMKAGKIMYRQLPPTREEIRRFGAHAYWLHPPHARICAGCAVPENDHDAPSVT